MTTLSLRWLRRIERGGIEQLPADIGWQIELDPLTYREIPEAPGAAGQLIGVGGVKLELA